MNRKGFFLAEETLKIIVAVICIVFLAFFVVSLYNSKTGANKIKDAEENLDRIKLIVSSLAEGGVQKQDIPNPKGWHIYSFTEEQKPNSCLGNNCLCICADSLIEQIKSQAKRCDDKGSCLVIQNLESKNLDIKINTFVIIKKLDGKILIGEQK